MITVQTVTYRFKYSEEHECCGDSGYQFPQQTQKTTGYRVYDGLKQKNILILHIYVILFFSANASLDFANILKSVLGSYKK